MASKKDFKQMSNQSCVDCGKSIKANVADRKKHPVRRCYKCHLESEGKAGHQMAGKKGLPYTPTFKRAGRKLC